MKVVLKLTTRIFILNSYVTHAENFIPVAQKYKKHIVCIHPDLHTCYYVYLRIGATP